MFRGGCARDGQGRVHHGQHADAGRCWSSTWTPGARGRTNGGSPSTTSTSGSSSTATTRCRSGRFQIRGDLFSKAARRASDAKHAIAFVQYFDYVNNNAYEFGGQSFGGALFSRFQPSESVGIQTRLDLSAMILGAVNSEYAYIVETEEQERLREYDYGPGAGASIEASGFYKGQPLLSLAYRFQWINVKNGSVYMPEEESASDGKPGGLRRGAFRPRRVRQAFDTRSAAG